MRPRECIHDWHLCAVTARADHYVCLRCGLQTYQIGQGKGEPLPIGYDYEGMGHESRRQRR